MGGMLWVSRVGSFFLRKGLHKVALIGLRFGSRDWAYLEIERWTYVYDMACEVKT